MYKIYKIVDNTNGNIYIGITTQTLKQRLACHKSLKDCSSRAIIKNGDYKIELIEETDDKTRERYWIENTDCVNRIIPGRTKKEYNKEYRENNREKIKEWRENNKEKAKEYYENNKESISQYHKKYRENNREKKSQYSKEYKKNNRESILQYHKKYYYYINSMGGDPRFNNNLLKIDHDLFILN